MLDKMDTTFGIQNSAYCALSKLFHRIELNYEEFARRYIEYHTCHFSYALYAEIDFICNSIYNNYADIILDCDKFAANERGQWLIDLFEKLMKDTKYLHTEHTLLKGYFMVNYNDILKTIITIMCDKYGKQFDDYWDSLCDVI